MYGDTTADDVRAGKINSASTLRSASEKNQVCLLIYIYLESSKHISSPFRGTRFCSYAAVLKARVYAWADKSIATQMLSWITDVFSF